MRRQRLAERVAGGIDGEVSVFGEQMQVPGHLAFQAGLELQGKGRRRRFGLESKWLMPGSLGLAESAPVMDTRATPAPTPRSGKIRGHRASGR